MAYSICKIKNLTGEITTLNGHQFAVSEVYTIQDTARLDWSNDEVLLALSEDDFEIHDSAGAISGLSDQINWLHDHAPIEATIEHTSKYSMKVDGASAQVTSNGVTTIDLKIVNFTGESYTDKYLKGGELFGNDIEYGDSCRFFICDVDNILGYGAGTEIKSFVEKTYIKPAPCPNHFQADCPAKIPVGLYLRCVYTATSAGSTRAIFVNYNLHNKD